MSRLVKRLVVLAVLLGTVSVALLVPGGGAVCAAALAPALATFALLMWGRYPGEGVLVAARAARRRDRRPSLEQARPPARRLPSRRGPLISRGLAGRAPPVRLIPDRA